MPVSARVVGDPGRLSASGAAVAMPAQRRGAAAHDGQQHLPVLPVDPSATVFDKCLSGTANNVGHLHERPVIQLCCELLVMGTTVHQAGWRSRSSAVGTDADRW